MFKKGDKVKRINSSFGSMKVGDVGTVSGHDHIDILYLENSSHIYDSVNFELVSEKSSEEEKTTGLSLKEAVCAMIDGEKVRVAFTNHHIIYLSEDEGFLYKYEGKSPEPAKGVLDRDNIFEIIPKKKPTITFEGGTYYQEDFYAAIKDLEEIE